MSSRGAAITKARIFVACWASILVLVSSVYSMTSIFTKQVVKELILDQKLLNLRQGSKHLVLDYDVPNGVQSISEEKKKKTIVEAEFSLEEIEAIEKRNPERKIKDQRQLDKETKKLRQKAKEKQPKQKDQQQINKDKKKLRKKNKKQVWKEESADIGEITSTGNILNDTTVIITTNWMPSVPSTDQLDKVIRSLSNFHGLPKDAPMVIAIDGAYEDGARYESKMNVDMRAYVAAIQAKYHQPNVQIIASDTKIMLVGNMKRALRKVHTQFVLVLQHDLPFINPINHTALIETMEAHSQVRIVRFHTARVLTRKRDSGVCNEDEVDFEDARNGIQLTKTHIWSDRNHLTRKSYYAEMFQLPGWSGVRNMEFHMDQFGKDDCEYWGTHLFGPRGGHPTIFHLDGRGDGQHRTSTKRVFGNLTGLLD